MSGPVLRPMRLFVNRYHCVHCGERRDDEMLTISYSWCPYCEARTEPHDTEELLADMLCDAEEIEE